MNASTSPRRRRPARLSTARTLGWLAAASLVFAALAPTAAANSHGQSNSHGQGVGNGDTGAASDGNNGNNGDNAQVERNPTCQDLYPSTLQLKIDSAPSDGTVAAPGLTITISAATSTSFDWTSDASVTAVIVKGGQGGYNLYAGGTSGAGLTTPNNPNGQPAGISHVEFCYVAGTDSVTPPTTGQESGGSVSSGGSDASASDGTTGTSTDTTTGTSGNQGRQGDQGAQGDSTTGTSTDTTTGSPVGQQGSTTAQVQVVATGGDQAVPPTGGVLGAVSKPVTTGPRVTPPPTDTMGTADSRQSPAQGWRLVLLGLAALIASLLLMSQRTARQRI